MGNHGSRAIDSAQEKRKCTKKNAFSAMKESQRNRETQDEKHVKSKGEHKKLWETMNKAISGPFHGEERRLKCGSRKTKVQNDSEAEIQGTAGQDDTEEERVTEDQKTSRDVRRVEVKSEQESSLLRQVDDLTKDVTRYKEQARNNNARYNQVCTEKQNMDTRIRRLEVQLEEVREENRLLLNRLSKLSALRLYDNNPNITDLNDVNRPLKLAEQFNILYDDLWTDSFQLLQQRKMNEGDIIHLLLKIVQVVFEICKEHAMTMNVQLQNAILNYTGLNKKKSNETVVIEVMKIVREYRKENLKYSLKNIQKNVQCKLKDMMTDTQMQQINSFTEECTRLCWLMNIQDPQMFLSFGQVSFIGEGGPSPFDNTCFISYTHNGMYVEFVVWPALFLHEGGPLLKKGVAQGTNTPFVVARSATSLKSTCNSESINKIRKGGKSKLLKKLTGKFKSTKQQGLQDEEEVNRMHNAEDLVKEIENEDNSSYDNQHVNPVANEPSSPDSNTHETNNISLLTRTNISQVPNHSSDITNVEG
ncbi:hypothetical protein CHS0354_004206 [Potamilus streckersoni]|uniref:Mitochondria-eating protein n=1 Tax=Potamilus streckersoni TaxID=2493646 RepID=A0AAE0RRJ7_9BIVA|nr:hypothetical protein CHS0354_004206 [Potamilus streckersoni]